MYLGDNGVGTGHIKMFKDISNLSQQISGRAVNETFLSLGLI